MKRLISSVFRLAAHVKIFTLAVFVISLQGVNAQTSHEVTGKLIDGKNNQPVPYASVSLFRIADQKLVGGALSDDSGQFRLGPVTEGYYKLMVNFLGYRPESKILEVKNTGVADAGTIVLQDTIIAVADAFVVGERTKAKTESNRTTFFVSQKMIDASGTGTDILKLIPGIQIDLMQNISVEGSRDIVIYVDGKERDRSYVSQLTPDQIDKVEIISVPTAKYDGNISKALNIILKKKRDSGFSGKVYSEIPVISSVIYIFPAFSMNYGYKKINLYASYNGEIAYMDLHESTYREAWNLTDTSEYKSNQYVRQKNQNHRFSYGLDYFITDRDELSLYSYCNPYYMEFKGTAGLEANGVVKDSWLAEMDDKFNSTTNLYSLFYKHSFEKAGSELTLDMSGNTIRAKGTTAFGNDESVGNDNSLTSTTKPEQKGMSIKMDFITPVGKNMNISTGVKGQDRRITNDFTPDFRYSETILAAYGSFGYKPGKYEITAGLRVEKSFTELHGILDGSLLSLLPDAAFRYKIGLHQNLQLSYKRTVRRPDIYQLNPSVSYDDPVTIRSGNPYLRPEFQDIINFEYSLQTGNNYFSSRLIYLTVKDAINNLTVLNGYDRFEIQPGNLGTVSKFGLQVTGALKIGNLSLNPYLVVFNNHSSVNDYALQHGVESRNQLCLASSISAVWSFKKDFALSSVLQYNTPQNNVQDDYFCDALYFLSFDKTFRNRIKAGIGSGLMFTRSFIHSASNIDARDFSSRYRGFVTMPTVPLWFRISYQFNTGKIRNKINHEREDVSVKPDKGF
jgi:hypothetical protein